MASPLLLPFFVPLAWLTPGLAYLLTEGRWLVLACALTAAVELIVVTVRRRPVALWDSAEALLARVPARVLWPLLGAAAFLVMTAVIPGHRWTGDSLGGDEPKYLRIADSLYRDLDADVASTAADVDVARNLRSLWRSAAAALVGLGDSRVPEGHRWSVGNLTVAGRFGGLYHLQSPGLPALLLPALALQPHVFPGHGGPKIPMLVLAFLWALTLVECARFANDVSGSRVAALLSAVLVCMAAPVFVNGHHFFPEIAAAPVVPWTLRQLRRSDVRVTPARAVLVGLVLGSLPWLHPKFLPLALALGVIVLVQVRRTAILTVLAAAVPLVLLLLYDHRITGLLRPDALYQRYGFEMVAGASTILSTRLLNGLVTAWLGARDGLMIMGPVCLAALLGAGRLWRRDRRTAVQVGLVAAASWITAAIHEGGAPGPPARLMVPVAVALVVPLAVALAELRGDTAFRWTVGTLALLSLAITVTMVGNWRRTVNPYRGMFATADTNFGADLPDPPRPSGEPYATPRRMTDLARGVLIAAAVMVAARSFARRTVDVVASDAVRRGRELGRFFVVAWSAVVGSSILLHALGG